VQKNQTQELKDKLNQQIQEAQERLSLSEQFTDLREYRGRWQTYLIAKSVNPIAEGVDFVHSCGCCDDASLYAMPYVDRKNQRIYSDPCQIVIGEKAGYDALGEKPRDTWEETVREHELPDHIIEKIRTFFKENKVTQMGEDE